MNNLKSLFGEVAISVCVIGVNTIAFGFAASTFLGQSYVALNHNAIVNHANLVGSLAGAAYVCCKHDVLIPNFSKIISSIGHSCVSRCWLNKLNR